MSTKRLIRQGAIALATSIAILSLVGCEALLGPPTYPVVRVSDGDTMTVIDDNENKISVRFACMDAPEVPHTNAEKQSKKSADRNQFQWGVKAQLRVQELVTQGGDRVSLIVTDSDRYGRQVSEVRLPDGTLIQEVLIREGLAQVYQQYLKNCPSAAILQQAEAEAKQARHGVWGDSKYVAPWEYRRLKK